LSVRMCCSLALSLCPYTTLFRSLGLLIGCRHRFDRNGRCSSGGGSAAVRGALRGDITGVDWCPLAVRQHQRSTYAGGGRIGFRRSEEHTSELQSREDLACRLLLA